MPEPHPSPAWRFGAPSLGALLGLFAVAPAACSGPTFETAEGKGGTSGASGKGGTSNAGRSSAGTGNGGGGGRGGDGGGSGTAGGSAGSVGQGGSAGNGARGGTGSGAGGSTVGGSSAGGEAGTGVGGTGGAPTCECAVGQYCRAGECRDCTDLSQLDFEAPEPILDHPNRGLRFPRPGDVPGSLFFTLEAPAGGELWYEASVDEPPGSSLGDASAVGRSGLLYFEDPDNTGFNSVFDETDGGGRRTARAARFVQGALTGVENAPAPLTPGDYDDYDVALAPLTGRFFWMSTRDGNPTLRHGLLGTSNADLVELSVARESGQGCALAADTPWVSANGSLLVVSAPSLDMDCQPLDGGATDLFAAPLSPNNGQPLAFAVPLADVNVSTGVSSETDAAFSSDLCTLYFASDGGEASGFDYRLFRALRR